MLRKTRAKLLARTRERGNGFRMLRFILFAILAIVPQAHTAEILFRDAFKGGLAEGWSWIREDKAAWRTTADGLEVRIQPGNMWGGENSGRNVLVRELPKPKGDGKDSPLEISMTVENDPTEQYEQVDLVAYYDDSNQVKIGEELVDGKLSIVMGREEKDRTRTLAIIPLQKTRVQLKLRISGKQVSGFFRPDGAEGWIKAGECDLPGQGAPRIALQCYQGSKDKEHWAKIQDFQIAQVPESQK